jgi:hypothetical protein
MYNIELNIPDVVISGTTIKRKAKLSTMIYNLKYESLTLGWEVSHYANNAGSYGEPLTFIPSYGKENVADNTTIVDVTGTILTPDSEGNYPEGSLGQFTWFNNIGENNQINVHDLIRQYGNAYTKWDK